MRCFIADFIKTTMPKKTTMKPKGPGQEVVSSWRLQIHNVKPETMPDKDGFVPMRIFGKSANAEYRLEYYDDHYSIHQLDKTRNNAQSWIHIQEKEAQHLLNGNGLIVDELVLEIEKAHTFTSQVKKRKAKKHDD